MEYQVRAQYNVWPRAWDTAGSFVDFCVCEYDFINNIKQKFLDSVRWSPRAAEYFRVYLVPKWYQDPIDDMTTLSEDEDPYFVEYPVMVNDFIQFMKRYDPEYKLGGGGSLDISSIGLKSTGELIETIRSRHAWFYLNAEIRDKTTWKQWDPFEIKDDRPFWYLDEVFVRKSTDVLAEPVLVWRLHSPSHYVRHKHDTYHLLAQRCFSAHD